MLTTVLEMFSAGQVDFLQLFILLGAFVLLILVLMPVHEFAHAFVAYKLGDNTARWNGRLTLNPLAHIDWMGAIMIMLFGIGFARPVPVNSRYFKNPKQGMALTALAGPVSNILMAVVSVAIFRVMVLIDGADPTRLIMGPFFVGSEWLYYAYIVLIEVFAGVNIGLAVFNLLPIPPLDGSRIFSAILPDKWVYYMNRYEQYIMMGLFLLLFTNVLDAPLTWLRETVGGGIATLFGMPDLM